LSDFDPDDADADATRRAWLAAPTHRGRVVRTLLALALTAAGLLLPVPYVGYAYGLTVFAPAAVLLGFALDWLGLPTALGLALSLLSFVVAASRYTGLMAPVAGWTLVTTLVALLLGAPRRSS
jgi:hypothetical protein